MLATTFRKYLHVKRRELWLVALKTPRLICLEQSSLLWCNPIVIIRRFLTERSDSAMVRAKEVNHDEEDARRAVPDLRAGDRDGRKWSRTYGGHVDYAIGDRAGRPRVGFLSLVLWIEVVLHRLSMRCELLFSLRTDLLTGWGGQAKWSAFPAPTLSSTVRFNVGCPRPANQWTALLTRPALPSSDLRALLDSRPRLVVPLPQ